MSKPKKIQIRNSIAEFLVFTTQAGEKGIEVRVEDETVWLTQKLIGALFDVDARTVSEHLQNIFSSGELTEAAVLRKFRNTASDGKSYLIALYNLNAIIAVGFRVNFTRATQFRQWAIGILRDFAIRGYVLDKDRLKNGAILDQAYFDNLLPEEKGFSERNIKPMVRFFKTYPDTLELGQPSVAQIASERRFYQKITDIYATPLPQLVGEVEVLAKKVGKHLAQMGFKP